MDADSRGSGTIVVAGKSIFFFAAMIVAISALPVHSQQLQPDVNSGVDADTVGDTEANARLRGLPSSDVPAISNPILLSRMLIPGQGIQILPIGTSLDQVRLEYGPPLKETTTGFLGKTNNWLYQADDGTDIILSGVDAVEEISVRGASDSTFITQEGITFGMAALEIIAFYGEPENENQDESFDYVSQGIRFELESGRIRIIVLSEPGS